MYIESSTGISLILEHFKIVNEVRFANSTGISTISLCSINSDRMAFNLPIEDGIFSIISFDANIISMFDNSPIESGITLIAFESNQKDFRFCKLPILVGNSVI
jgi:hypothetical protein